VEGRHYLKHIWSAFDVGALALGRGDIEPVGREKAWGLSFGPSFPSTWYLHILELHMLFSACSFLALVAGVGGYVLAGVEIGDLCCIFLCYCRC